MLGQLGLRAPADGPGEFVNLARRVKRDDQLEIRSRFSKNPASLMRDVKSLDGLAGHRGHEERWHAFGVCRLRWLKVRLLIDCRPGKPRRIDAPGHDTDSLGVGLEHAPR